VEWPKEISKFFSRQKLASISQAGFRVINISSLGVFYKNWGIYLEGVWLWRISGVTNRRWRGWFSPKIQYKSAQIVYSRNTRARGK